MATDGKLRLKQFLDVEMWFSGARDRVEDLAKGIGGVQQPSYFSSCSACSDAEKLYSMGSFDIGRVGEEERRQIPLASRVPIIMEPFLFEKKKDSDEVNDTEGLTEKLETRLLEESLVYARGKRNAINYINAKNATNGISPNGFYTISGDQITVVVSLVQYKKTFATVTAVGTREDVIEKLIKEIVKALPTT
jgi:hypothetical protein